MRKIWKVGLMVAVVVGVTGATATAMALSNKPSFADPVLVSYDGPKRGDMRVIGLAAGGKNLVSFRLDDPDKVRDIGTVRGLQSDTRLIGIDFRVQNAALYGVGDKGGIYTLSTKDAKATLVSQLTVALSGKDFDIDFNPAANRLRVISDTGQNLRHNIDDQAAGAAPASGTTANDTGLTTPPTAGATAGVTGAAYTNNDTNADTATTLFDLNTMTDQAVVQSPANNGTLAATGKLGVNAEGDAGFDIYSVLRGGVTVSNTALATLKVDGRQRLYQIDLLTGKANQLGAFPLRAAVIDIAIELN